MLPNVSPCAEIVLPVLTCLALAGSPTPAAADEKPREAVARIVGRVMKADYGDDRPELSRLFEQLAPYRANKELASRVDYWRGYALWRRALNGFNDSVDPKELEQDLNRAVEQFRESAAKDPNFADAKLAECSCLYNLMFLNSGNQTRIRELVQRAVPLLKEAQAAAPENPRLIWVLGANQWYRAGRDAEAQKKALEEYQRGLKAVHKPENQSKDLLEPAWGEPELLMNLAWSHLHANPPDPARAEEYAHSALKLVPEWHYVRDILLPQIREAKTKGK
jgi:hypothetical protein